MPACRYDVVVIGAGAAGLTASCVAAAEGLRVLLVEKSPLVGGTTAWSGGMVWLPVNRKMIAAGLEDTAEAARLYLQHAVPGTDNQDLREAFLRRGDEALAYLEARTELRLRPVTAYPDYHPELPGATAGGRVLEPCPFDGRRLGAGFALLRPPLPEFTLFGGMMISRQDIPHLRRAGRSLRSAWRVARLLAQYGVQRLRATRGTTLHLGNALAGRLLLSATRLGVELRLGTAAERLTRQHGRITGVVLRGGDGTEQAVAAERAVILAMGGFSHDPALRAEYLPAALGDVSAACPTSTGDGIRLAGEVGGRVGRQRGGNGLWVPVSRFRRADGTSGVFPHTVTDRAKPGVIAVDRTGRRFVNEAVSYHDFVEAMLRTQAVPAFLLCDRRCLWRYGLGRVKPFTPSLRRYLADGSLLRASTIAGLARAIGADPQALTDQVAAYNADARQGRDRAFGRGSDIYQRHLGDAGNRPNPCVAPIESAPFFAVALYPADLGTAAGLATNPDAQVLGPELRPIEGLYACGNDMASVMNGAYPGPGITLGPALTFGYLAARHAAGLSRPAGAAAAIRPDR